MTARDWPRLLRRKEVERLLRCSRWTLSRIIARDPTFPPEVELLPGHGVFREDQVLEWLRRKELAARGVPPPAPISTHQHVDAEAARGEDENPISPPDPHHETSAATAGAPRRA